jgi:hypothetical protein
MFQGNKKFGSIETRSILVKLSFSLQMVEQLATVHYLGMRYSSCLSELQMTYQMT